MASSVNATFRLERILMEGMRFEREVLYKDLRVGQMFEYFADVYIRTARPSESIKIISGQLTSLDPDKSVKIHYDHYDPALLRGVLSAERTPIFRNLQPTSIYTDTKLIFDLLSISLPFTNKVKFRDIDSGQMFVTNAKPDIHIKVNVSTAYSDCRVVNMDSDTDVRILPSMDISEWHKYLRSGVPLSAPAPATPDTNRRLKESTSKALCHIMSESIGYTERNAYGDISEGTMFKSIAPMNTIYMKTDERGIAIDIATGNIVGISSTDMVAVSPELTDRRDINRLHKRLAALNEVYALDDELYCGIDYRGVDDSEALTNMLRACVPFDNEIGFCDLYPGQMFKQYKTSGYIHLKYGDDDGFLCLEDGETDVISSSVKVFVPDDLSVQELLNHLCLGLTVKHEKVSFSDRNLIATSPQVHTQNADLGKVCISDILLPGGLAYSVTECAKAPSVNMSTPFTHDQNGNPVNCPTLGDGPGCSDMLVNSPYGRTLSVNQGSVSNVMINASGYPSVGNYTLSGPATAKVREEAAELLTATVSSTLDRLFNEKKIPEVTTNNNNLKVEGNNMFGINFEFGKVEGSLIKMSMYGLAFATGNGRYATYDNTTGQLTDVTEMLVDFGGDMVFQMPHALKDVADGDIIKHNDKYVIVLRIDDDIITVVDPLRSESVNIVPKKNMFGFNYVTKVVNIMGSMFSGNAASAENPFGGMMPMLMMSMMMGDSNGENGNSDNMMGVMMMSAMMGGAGGSPFAALGGETSTGMASMLPMLMMSGMLDSKTKSDGSKSENKMSKMLPMLMMSGMLNAGLPVAAAPKVETPKAPKAHTNTKSTNAKPKTAAITAPKAANPPVEA